MKALFFLLLFTVISLTDSRDGRCDQPLRVGAIVRAPFVTKQGEVYSGLAIDLWSEMAGPLKKPYEIKDYSQKGLEALFDDLQAGKLDVLIGALSVTQDRYQKVNFTFPYFIDTIIAITTPDYMHNFLLFVKMFFISSGSILFIFVFIFFLYINLLWHYERHHIPDFPTSYRHGIVMLFWSHVLTGRSLDVPRTAQGKIVIFCQKMIFHFVLIILNGTFISFMTVTLVNYASPVQNVFDLEKVKIGAVVASKPFKLGSELGLRVIPYDSFEAGITALQAGEIKAFLQDSSLAESYLKEHSRINLVISPFDLKQDLYSFAVQKGSPLLEKINSELLDLQHRDVTEKICAEYLQTGAKKHCAF